MSEENKDFELQNEEQGISIDKAKQMTVGEAVRKDTELKAGITEDDSVLDKYIKQHRQEVASQKFETKVSEVESLDTASLDNFIKKQREELAKTGFFNQTSEEQKLETEAEEDLALSSKRNDHVSHGITDEIKEDQKPVFDQVEPVVPIVDSSREDDQVAFLDSERSGNKKSKKKFLLALLSLLLLLVGGAFGLNVLKQNDSGTTNTKVSSQQSSSKDSKASLAKKAYKAFDKGLKAFYLDDEMTKLKNSEMTHLDDLTKKLDALKNTNYYDKAKEKWESLKKQITAIQTVNGKFSTEAIKDGQKTAATIKSDANFDDFTADSLKTGNATLDKLLQEVVSDGRKQVDDKNKAEKEKADAQAKADAEQKAAQDAATAEQDNAAQSATTTSGATTGAQAPATGGTYGTAASGIQRNLSRVPYNNAAIADSTNAAWLFNPGVLEKIIATSQARGYFTGNNYYLEPVNIINGNGYYNMFKSDGTYLFSINCKTGYFVGNASGYADGLDY